ncbi:unnamed protein product [Rhizoctonia solani]|uniref:Uncharacterized protein n=1 Tax=Rhizoctonia solani TaxID=456999 RepID=A0A8H3BXZ5_9AGAM|nr:unnamed protein product [Rhizoctonia solani]
MFPSELDHMVAVGVITASYSIDFGNPNLLYYIRLAYFIIQLVRLAALFLVFIRIKAKNDLTVFRFADVKSIWGKEPSAIEIVNTNIRGYDLEETFGQMFEIVLGVLGMGVLHGLMGFNIPLVIRVLLNLVEPAQTQLFAIHLFGLPATGHWERPFVSPRGWFGIRGVIVGGTARHTTDPNRIKELERFQRMRENRRLAGKQLEGKSS